MAQSRAASELDEVLVLIAHPDVEVGNALDQVIPVLAAGVQRLQAGGDGELDTSLCRLARFVRNIAPKQPSLLLARCTTPTSLPLVASCWQCLKDRHADLKTYEALAQAVANMTAAAQPDCQADMAALDQLWIHCLQDSLATMASQSHPGIVTCCNMIAYNCVLKLDLYGQTIDPRNPVLYITRQSLIQLDNNAVAADGDFVVFLIELLCTKPAFVDVYRGLDMALPEVAETEESAEETPISSGCDGLSADFTTTSAEEVLGAERPSQRVVVPAEGIQAKAILLNFLQHRILLDHTTTGWPLLLPLNNILFLAERFGLLAYVAQDQEWWGSAANTPSVLQFLAVLATVGQAVVHVKLQAQIKLGAVLIEPCLDLLRHMGQWHQRSTPKLREANPRLEADVAIKAHGLARDLIKLIANLTAKNKVNQDLVRLEEGIQVVLSRFLHDDRNPYIRGALLLGLLLFGLSLFGLSLLEALTITGVEWSVLALHNLCEGNLANQAIVAAVESKPHAVVKEDELSMWDMEVEVDEATGRLRPTPPS